MSGIRTNPAPCAVDWPRRRYQRICQPVCASDGLLWSSFRCSRYLYEWPDARKAGQCDRGAAANPDRRSAQGAREEQEEVMSRSSSIHPLVSKTAAMTRMSVLVLTLAATLAVLSAPA